MGTHAQGQSLYKKPLYDAVSDFTPVALIAEIPIVLITRKDLRSTILPNSSLMQKRIRPACSTVQPGPALRLTWVASCSITSSASISPTFLIAAPVRQCRYSQGGRIDYLCEIVSTAKPQIDGGTVKAIAIMTKERSKALPNVPTALEQGTPNLEAYTWNAIFLPKGAPPEVVRKLHEATLGAMQTASVRERLESLGAVIVPEERATPQYLAQFVKSEIDRWAGPIKASGVTIE